MTQEETPEEKSKRLKKERDARYRANQKKAKSENLDDAKPAKASKPKKARAPKKREYAGKNAPEESLRNKRLQVRMRENQDKNWKRAAELESDLDTSAWARRVLDREAAKVLEKHGKRVA